jgi:hypothetical protein
VDADAPPQELDRFLPWLVAGSAAAVLLTEIALTRLFSVLLYYHYSFLAVAIALFGLAAGGLSVSRESAAGLRVAVTAQLRLQLRRAAVALVGVTLFLRLAAPASEAITLALGLAVLSAVPLFLLGKTLALSMALGRNQIHRLYAVDLVASATAALIAIPLLAMVQGPLVLAVPALLALALDVIIAPPGHRIVPGTLTILLAAVLAFAASQPGPLLTLSDPWPGDYVLERWNAHSRVRVSDWNPSQRMLVIDKAAASLIPRVDVSSDHIPQTSMSLVYRDPSYVLGRSSRRVAIIGVGGGPDLVPALNGGATTIDGFELNGRIIELLTGEFRNYNAAAQRPEVHLIHDEARHALEHSRSQYDVIRANLIDTWAATAAGGFVLAENGIYTVEAWRLFLRRLTPSGVLVITRWYLPAAPAEAQRLTALGAEALEAEGIRPAAQHLVALTAPTNLQDPLAGGGVQTITTIVSHQPFSDAEIASLEQFARRGRGNLLLAPGRTAEGLAASWQPLLSAETRDGFIKNSSWDIEPPTDQRPFFFLQIRPADVFRFWEAKFGDISTITVNGVRVLLAAAALAIVAALLLTILTNRGLKPDSIRLPVGGRWYFALLGLAYLTVQLALLQRLSLIIGHPTTTLALVIATMLMGTGVGSALAGHPRLRWMSSFVLSIPVILLIALIIAFPHVGALSQLPSLTVSAVGAGSITGLTGIALGVAFPTGIRIFARSDTAVAEAWALNGAFSVVGSVLAAIVGLMFGSRYLLGLAVPLYALAWLLVTLESKAIGSAAGASVVVAPGPQSPSAAHDG